MDLHNISDPNDRPDEESFSHSVVCIPFDYWEMISWHVQERLDQGLGGEYADTLNQLLDVMSRMQEGAKNHGVSNFFIFNYPPSLVSSEAPAPDNLEDLFNDD